jgi:hypothetical protein
MGLETDASLVTKLRPGTPKISFLSQNVDYITSSGEKIN